MIKTAIILTVYNRKEVTLQGLRSLYEAIKTLGNDYTFDIYMTDDGCSDGTVNAVREEFPEIHIIKGNGKLFWNQGMRKAWQAANSSQECYDFYLWFNDDIKLYKSGLQTLFESSIKNGNIAIVSGAFCDDNGIVSYGGWSNNELVTPNGQPQQVEKINGNLVLVPKAVYDIIGMLDEHFRHSYGDWEYGIRARKAGIQLVITPSYVGTCNRHDTLRKCYDSEVSLTNRLKDLYSPNSVCPKDLLYYNCKCNSLYVALKSIVSIHLRTLFPNT